MMVPFSKKKMSSFRIIILGFLGLILVGTLLLMLPVSSRDGRGASISAADHLPLGTCIFETVSAIGTVGLSFGITPSLSLLSHLILILLMFFGRVGGLTLMYAAINIKTTDVSQRPVEKINVG